MLVLAGCMADISESADDGEVAVSAQALVSNEYVLRILFVDVTNTGDDAALLNALAYANTVFQGTRLRFEWNPSDPNERITSPSNFDCTDATDAAALCAEARR